MPPAAVRLGCGKSVVSRRCWPGRYRIWHLAHSAHHAQADLDRGGQGGATGGPTDQPRTEQRGTAQGSFSEEVRSTLRIACPRPLGSATWCHLITEFTRLHLGGSEPCAVDTMADLIAEQIDVAIRAAQRWRDLVARKLDPRALVAAPAIWERAGTLHPKTWPQHVACCGRATTAYDEYAAGHGPAPPWCVQGRIHINDGLAWGNPPAWARASR